MRFSIFEYSQEKLLTFGLDITDALLLNWFVNFFSGKMEKRIFKDEEGHNKVFGWIKISKVIEDLPVLGISSEKGIRRRFDNFVEKGLLERETISSQLGKKSYYKTTDLYETLINAYITRKENQNNPQGNSSTYAENTAIQNKENDPQGTKKTLAKNEAEKNEEKSPQGNSSTFAQGKFNTYAQGNSSTFALNDSLINDTVVKNTAAMQDLADKYFGKNAFDSQFAKKAAAFLKKQDIHTEDNYFEFIKNRVTKKSQDSLNNPRGFAYKLFFQADIAAEFKEREQQLILEKQKEQAKKDAEEKRKTTCPVCAKSFLPDFKYSCPCCGFEISKFSNPDEINMHRRFLKLPAEKRRDYESRLNEIYQPDFLEFMRLTEAEKEEKRRKQNEKVLALQAEFGLTE